MDSDQESGSTDATLRRSPWWAIDELCEQHVRGQHAALRLAATALGGHLAALADRQGDRAPGLLDLSVTFETLAATLLSHLAKEENILFPAFAALAAAWRNGTSAPPLPFPSLRHPISLMEAEHDRLEQTLAHMDEIAATLSLPEDAAQEWELCRAALARFKRDLEADTSLEDDVLFPRALELERALL